MKTQVLVLLAVCAGVSVVAVAPAPAAAARHTTETGSHKRLFALFAASDEGALKRNPIQALVRNDLRYADQFGDYISDAYFAAEKAAAVRELAELARIDRRTLSSSDQVSYDVFKWQRTSDLQGLDADLLKATIVRPIDHFNGMQTFMPEVSSGEGPA